MASDIFTGSETISTTEHSLVTDTAGPDVETSDANLRIHIDWNGMSADTVIELKVYEKDTSSGTQRVMWSRTFAGIQAVPGWQSPRTFTVRHGWDVTLDKLSGTDAAITWALVDDSGSAPSAASIADAVWDEARAGHVAAGSFGEGVVVNSIANAAITAASIAADAITAAKVAADVSTEIVTAMMAFVVENAGTTTLRRGLARLFAVAFGRGANMDNGTSEFYGAGNDSQVRVTSAQDGNDRAAPTFDDTGI